MAEEAQQPAETERPRHRFTVENYHRMREIGILREDERLELVEGQVIYVGPISPRQAACTRRLNESLRRELGDSALVRVQIPVTIPDYDESEPDIAVLRPREDGYEGTHPTPADVLLLIEVADAALEVDRALKLPLYARAGIPETWLCVLPDRAIERHTDPDPESGAYRSVTTLGPGETLTSQALPTLALPVDSVLGRASRKQAKGGGA